MVSKQFLQRVAHERRIRTRTGVYEAIYDPIDDCINVWLWRIQWLGKHRGFIIKSGTIIAKFTMHKHWQYVSNND